MPWYSFTPVDAFPHDPADANNYTLIGSTPPSCPSPNNNLCAIQASDNSGSPNITPALVEEIAIALENNVDRTTVLLKP